MKRKSMATMSLVLVVAMIAISLWIGRMLPPGAELPIHWDAAGHPNGYAGKWAALLLPATTTGLISMLFYFLPAIEPRGEHLERSQGLVLAGWGGLLIVNATVELTIVSGALGWNIPVTTLMLIAVGLLFLLIGNQLGKSRSMFLVGIRTPWTLASEDVWIKTHRLGGKLTMLAGLLMIIGAFLPFAARGLPILILGLVAAMVGVPVIYSFYLYRRELAKG